jgi:predicted amino acid-binding ACT domain protein
MVSKSVRLQMLSETEQYLEEKAQEYKCLYNDKPSISSLLAHIARGELQIVPPSNLKKKISGEFIEIKLTTFLNLKGITYVVSDKISQLKGNILKVQVQPTDHLGILKFLIDIKEEKIGNLIKSLQEIKIKDILEFNIENLEQYKKNPEKFIIEVEKSLAEILQATGNNFNGYNLNSSDKKESMIKVKNDFLITLMEQEHLLKSIYCTLGIKVTTKNQPGVLTKVSREISNQKILISSINLDFDPILEQAIINIFLELRPKLKGDDIIGLEKVKEVIANIEAISEVKGVERLGEEFLA